MIVKDLMKVKVDKKYGVWYYECIEKTARNRQVSDVYKIYNKDQKLVAKCKSYTLMEMAIMSGDIEGYLKKYQSDIWIEEDYEEIYHNAKLVYKKGVFDHRKLDDPVLTN